MTKMTLPAGIMAVAAALSGCATTGTKPTKLAPVALAESISYSVEPCFGFCPVYDVALTANGKVDFDGKRHTTVLGTRTREVGAIAYDEVAAALAPFRPATGTSAKTTCDVEASDLATYHIVWTRADGQKTVLDHNLGCRSEANDRLNTVLQHVPDMLGIAAWSRQISRPGAPRG